LEFIIIDKAVLSTETKDHKKRWRQRISDVLCESNWNTQYFIVC